MPGPVTIRLADPEPTQPAVAAIYAPHVLASVASFELEPPDAREMARRMGKTLAWAPWLVAVSDGQVVGYAYAVRHRERAGYRWAVDLSVYVGRSHARESASGGACTTRCCRSCVSRGSSTRMRASRHPTRPASRSTPPSA